MDRHTGIYDAYCTACCKQSWARRKHARRQVRKSSERGMWAYRCPVSEYWHIGHLPKPVRKGETTAAEHYERYGR